MKLNKIMLFAVTAASAMLFTLPACSGGETAHTHTYSEAWSYDAANHWHEPTCGDTTEKSNFGQHTYQDGVCSICGYQNPNGTPSGGEVEKPDEKLILVRREEALFEGDFTPVSDEDKISQVKIYLEGQVALLKEGKGYAAGDITYHENANSIETIAAVSGAAGDLNQAGLKFRQTQKSLHFAGEHPVCYTAGDYAFEEYTNETDSFYIPGVGNSVTKKLADKIYGYFGGVSNLFESDCTVSFKQEGDVTVIKLSYLRDSRFDGEDLFVDCTQNITSMFAFSEGKLVGLRYTLKTQIEDNSPDADYYTVDGTVSVIVGETYVTLPKNEDCTEKDTVPDWTQGFSGGPAVPLRTL